MERPRPKRDRSGRDRSQESPDHAPGVGLCRGCFRSMFLHGEAGADFCVACLLSIRRHPGVDVTTLRNGRSERLPAERPDTDDMSWQDDARCFGAPIELFEGRMHSNAVIPNEEFDIAYVFCGHCPVLDQCNAWADEHEFLGIFGGYYRASMGVGRERVGVYTRRDLLGDLRPVPAEDEAA
jgi:Transcription factor WhiB